MIKVFDFKCGSCGHTYELFTDSDTRTDNCPICGGVSDRLVAAPRFKLEGVTGDFPTAYDRWAKVHEKAGEKGRKEDRERQLDGEIL